MRNPLSLRDLDPRYRPTLARHTASWLLWGVFAGCVTQQIGFAVRKIGGAPSLVSLVTTGPMVVAFLAPLYSPRLERFPARPLVAASRIVTAGLFLAAAGCVEPWQLALLACLALAVLRVGESFYGRLLALMYPSAARGRMQSIPLFAGAAATAVMSVLAGLVLRGGEAVYRWFFPAAGAVGVLGALLLSTVPLHGQDVRRATGRLRETLTDAVRDRPFLAWCLVYSVTGTGYWFTACALPVHFAGALRMDYLSNGIAQAALMAVYCVSFFPWGRLLDRHRSLPIMTAGWTLVAAGTAVVALGGSFEWAIVGQVLAGLGYGANDIAWFPVILEYAPAEKVDRYTAFYMCLYGLRAIVGGLGSGLIMELFPVGGSGICILTGSSIIALGVCGMLAMRAGAGRSAPSGA